MRHPGLAGRDRREAGVSAAADAGTMRTAPDRSGRSRRSRTRRTCGRPRSSGEGRCRPAARPTPPATPHPQPLRVRLQFEEDHGARDVHRRIAVDRVRAEVTDAGDHPPVGAAVDVGVGWTYVAVNQRWSHHGVGQPGRHAGSVVQPPHLAHWAGRAGPWARLTRRGSSSSPVMQQLAQGD